MNGVTMYVRLFFLLSWILLWSVVGHAQKPLIQEKTVSKAYYFDKTPPLRDMAVIEPHIRDRSWKNYVIKNPSVEMSFENNQGGGMAPLYDATWQMAQGTRSSRGPEVNIPGVSNVNGVMPPDTDGDVGPNHYMQMINLSFAIWDKEGNKLYGPVDNSTLWQGFIGPWTGTNDGDPIVLYDDMADRWLASQFAVHVENGKFYELVAISATPDPLGEWYRYAFEYDVFVDYPHLGIWRDAYYMTTNNFNGGFVGIGVHAYEREAMLAGDPDAQMAYYQLNSWAGFSMQPADCDGTLPPPEGEPGLFIVKGDNSELDLYEFEVDWENPENTDFSFAYSIPVASYNSNVWGISQPNTTQELDALSSMIMYRLQYRNMEDHQAMVMNHTVSAGGVAGIRWYELRKTDAQWDIYQQGTFAPGDGLNRWMGSIAMNANGDIALGYTVSNAMVYPSIRYTGRAAEDPLGEMTFTEMEIIGGTDSQTTGSRWGDYSNIAVDPSNDSLFWHTNEYVDRNWKTRIASFSFGPPKMPEVDAGPDTTICYEQFYETTAAIGRYCKSLHWETSGDGRWIPSNELLYTNYRRGSEDVEHGGVTLSLFAEGYGSTGTVSDSMRLSIQNLPTLFAGNDTTICNNHSLPLSGRAVEALSTEWKTDGDGYFDDPFSLETTYHPGVEDFAEGNVYLRLYGNPIEPCVILLYDKMKLSFDNCAGEEEALPLFVKVDPNPVSDLLTIHLHGLREEAILRMVDSEGNVVYTDVLNASSSTGYRIDVKDLPKGVYVVNIQCDMGVFVEKVIKQ